MGSIKQDIDSLKERLHTDGVDYGGLSVLVTGGAGFLGSWMCEVIAEQGARVLCLDNFSSGLESNILRLKENGNVVIIEHDVSDPISLAENVDIILHLASRASPLEFSKFPIEILDANTLGTRNVLNLAVEQGARLLLASTSEVYGDPPPEFIPTSEDYWGNVNPIGVRSCYDEAKRVAEAYTVAYVKRYNVDARIVRIHNTYGPRMRTGDVYGRVVTRFIDQAIQERPLTIYGDGLQTRSFTYITDMIKGILSAAHKKDLGGEIINLGSNKETRIIDLALKILKLTKSKSAIEYQPLPQDDPRRRCPDTSKATKLLNWKSEVRLEVGLSKTIHWVQSQR